MYSRTDSPLHLVASCYDVKLIQVKLIHQSLKLSSLGAGDVIPTLSRNVNLLKFTCGWAEVVKCGQQLHLMNRNLNGTLPQELMTNLTLSKHSSWWRRTEDIFSVTFFCLLRRLQGIIPRCLLEDVFENKTCLLG